MKKQSQNTVIKLRCFFNKIKVVNYWSAAKIIQVSSFMSYNFFVKRFCIFENVLQSVLEN